MLLSLSLHQDFSLADDDDFDTKLRVSYNVAPSAHAEDPLIIHWHAQVPETFSVRAVGLDT